MNDEGLRGPDVRGGDPDRLAHLGAFRRFHVRTTLAFGALAIGLLTVMALASYRWAIETERSALAARLRALAVTLAEGVDARDVHGSLAEGDRAAHGRLIAAFAGVGEDEADVQSIYVAVPDAREGYMRFSADWVRRGEPAAIGERYDARALHAMRAALEAPEVEEEIKTDRWGPSLSGYAPVRDPEGRAVAVLGVDVSAGRVARIERRAQAITAVAYTAAIVVLFATGLLLGRSVRRPIARIVEASGAIARGDFATRVGLDRRDELGILARRFDRMAIELEGRERLRAIFGRYVSEDVARRALASPDADRLGGEEREVTILFVSIQRFATISAALEPAEVVAMLERYLGEMTAIVEQHGGCVIELLGDAILGVFGAPAALDDHPTAAVRAGLAMKARLEVLAGEWRESGLEARWEARGVDAVRPRIGVHTGEVVAGNTGGKTRMKYAVIGDTVNVAARIEVLNERLGTSMLISAEVHARLPDELSERGEARGEHAVKGRDRAVAVLAY